MSVALALFRFNNRHPLLAVVSCMYLVVNLGLKIREILKRKYSLNSCFSVWGNSFKETNMHKQLQKRASKMIYNHLSQSSPHDTGILTACPCTPAEDDPGTPPPPGTGTCTVSPPTAGLLLAARACTSILPTSLKSFAEELDRQVGWKGGFLAGRCCGRGGAAGGGTPGARVG